jgi:hypothetical protein
MKIIYYYHIPKCGGSTIYHQLKELSVAVGGEFFNFNSSMKKFGFLEKLNNDFKMRLFLRKINNKTNDFKFIHHHHGFYGISQILSVLRREKRNAILAGNEFHLFSCIRDPISFQRSHVNYLRNSCGMPDFSFDDVCANPMRHNFMLKYLLRNHNKRWKEFKLDKQDLMKSLEIMDKVFVLEKLQNLYDWLEQIVGIPIKSPKIMQNVGKHLLQPTEKQFEILKRTNTLDQFFYDSVNNSTDKI